MELIRMAVVVVVGSSWAQLGDEFSEEIMFVCPTWGQVSWDLVLKFCHLTLIEMSEARGSCRWDGYREVIIIPSHSSCPVPLC